MRLGAGTLAGPRLSVLGGATLRCLDACSGGCVGRCKPQGSRTRRQPVPVGFFPLGGKVGQLFSGLSVLLGSDPACSLSPPHVLPRLRGPEDPLEPAVGELAHMAQKARVALRNSCQALKFPSDHTSN